MKVLEINSFDFFSTGNIMLEIAEMGRKQGLEMYTASKKTSTSLRMEKKRDNHYLIGNRIEHFINREISSITDLQDCGSILSTLRFIRYIKKLSPDLIHIHDIAGYYLNIDLFFRFLKQYNKPVIWTFHCCWAYTGRCIYYDFIHCNKWQVECGHCTQAKSSFPKHQLFDLSKFNYNRKKKLFTSLNDLTVVAISDWMKREAEKSFFQSYPIKTIYDGINLSKFYPDCGLGITKRYGIENKNIVLGVASIWSERKGLKYFMELSKLLHDDFKIVLIGLSKEQIKNLPACILGLEKTFHVDELRNWYSEASVFVNPTMEEGLGLVNIESQACGTPVITFATGGAVECINEHTGIVVEQGNTQRLLEAILELCLEPKDKYFSLCVEQARRFDQEDKYAEYTDLYHSIRSND